MNFNLKDIDKVAVAKKAAKFVVSRSVSGILVTAVHTYVPTETKAQKAQLYIGAYAIGSMVAEKARDWTDQQVDQVIEFYRTLKNVEFEPKEQSPA